MRAVTFGIQNAVPWPAATYACCAARISVRTLAVSRAIRSKARRLSRSAAMRRSVSKARNPATTNAISAVAARVSLADRDCIVPEPGEARQVRAQGTTIHAHESGDVHGPRGVIRAESLRLRFRLEDDVGRKTGRANALQNFFRR